MAQNPEGYLLNGQPDVAEQTMRALELKGDLPQLIDPRYQLGVTVDDHTDFEYWALRRRLPFVNVITTAAVAAQFPQVAFHNSFGGQTSRAVMARVRRITLINQNVAAQNIQVGLNWVGLGSTAGFSQGTVQDDRVGTSLAVRSSAFGLSAGNSAALVLGTAGFRIFPVAPGGVVTVDFDQVLTNKPNSTAAFVSNLWFEGGTVLQLLTVQVEWWERKLLTSETS